MSVIRAFIAITLSNEINQRLDQVLDGLKSRLPATPVRWVQASNIHLTIKFLGDVSHANLELLTEMLDAETSRHAPFEISIGKLGVFPSIRRPKVIWVGVEAPSELSALHHGIEQEAARLGYAPEAREFSPHLTLGRVSRNADPDDYHRIADVLSAFKIGFLGALRVASVDLYKSELNPKGAVYSKLFHARMVK